MVGHAMLHDTEFYISDKIADVESLPFQPRPQRPQRQAAGNKERGSSVASAQEAEFSKANGSKRYWLWALLALSFIALAYPGRYFISAKLDQWFSIEQVSVEGQFQQLNRIAFIQQIAPIATGGFFSINLNRVQEAAMQFAWVESVVVRRIWPNRLMVNVTERQAVAYWRDEALISAKGDLFTPDNAALSGNLVQLAGPDGSERQVFEVYQSLISPLGSLGLNLASLQLDARGGWQFTTDGGLRVNLGKHEIEKRFTRFVQHFDKIAAAKSEAVKSVDMRYGNGFAVAWGDQQQNNQMAQRVQ